MTESEIVWTNANSNPDLQSVLDSDSGPERRKGGCTRAAAMIGGAPVSTEATILLSLGILLSLSIALRCLETLGTGRMANN
jgi:hypothetical protein